MIWFHTYLFSSNYKEELQLALFKNVNKRNLFLDRVCDVCPSSLTFEHCSFYFLRFKSRLFYRFLICLMLTKTDVLGSENLLGH